MGTNYYAKKWYFGHQVPYHIGKQSAGWAFCFAANKELHISTSLDWAMFIEDDRVTIEDEYGCEVEKRDFWMKVNQNKDRKTAADGLVPQDPGRARWLTYQQIDERGFWVNHCDREWS